MCGPPLMHTLFGRHSLLMCVQVLFHQMDSTATLLSGSGISELLDNTIFQLPFEMPCGFSTTGLHPISERTSVYNSTLSSIDSAIGDQSLGLHVY
ncbi:hypothetical protein CEXT_608411 [Caerostris extrusa]|uniref:Uncharacterized protein n=1 Tax=Caerostris extrusa TaxID=172846 RepID=A0AAV4TBZ7_CAEEX|nr:hypothetical protein CEXT_608411 [Caerostris extrusa]